MHRSAAKYLCNFVIMSVRSVTLDKLLPSSSTAHHFREVYNISKTDAHFPLNKIIFTSVMD